MKKTNMTIDLRPAKPSRSSYVKTPAEEAEHAEMDADYALPDTILAEIKKLSRQLGRLHHERNMHLDWEGGCTFRKKLENEVGFHYVAGFGTSARDKKERLAKKFNLK